MTRALVVYESMFGNTERVARAVAEGLAEHIHVDLARAGAGLTIPDDVDLVVVGGPTHAFGLTRPSTRVSAGKQGAGESAASGTGLREWLETLPPPTAHRPATAAFDTRIRKPGMPGSAARSAARRLRHAGLPVVVPPMSFWVRGTSGPLLPDEEGRARSWGRELVQTVARVP
jgi:hypothetical protein